MSRSSRWLYIFLGVFAGFIVVLKVLSVFADYFWYESVGQAAVFSTVLWTRLGLGLVVGVVFFAWLWWNGRMARRPLPQGVVLVGRRLLTDEERAQVDRYLDRILLLFALIAGGLVGLVASGHWLDWVHFRNPVPFGYSDPLFHRDASFYVFKLGFLLYLWRVAFYAVVVAFIMAVLVYFYQEAIRVVGNAVHAMPHARVHTLSLLAVGLLVKAVGYRLDQFRLVFSQRGEVFYGASYADIHARLPVLWLLLGLSILAAVACIAAFRSRRFLLPGGALSVLVVVSLLGGAAYPFLIQRLVVKPNQLEKERPYIAANIDATRVAFGLTNVKDQQFELRNDLDWAGVQRNWATVENLRLWDHRPLEQTFQQTQALRAYYTFPDVDVDRYWVGGRYRQVMLAPRQLDYSQIPPPQAWVKTYLQYTHGYGLCLAPVNTAGPEGLPVYWVRDIPPQCHPDLQVDADKAGLYYMASLHPRLIEYISRPEEAPSPAPRETPPSMDEVGEQRPTGTRSETARARPTTRGVQVDYAIVNTEIPELDYPQMGVGEEANVMTRYSGRGGVPVHGFFRRLCLAAKFTDIQILLTGAITKDSRIIMNRYLPEAFIALAPWIMYDPDPYLIIAGRELKWVCDAYTVSNRFPYSRPVMGLANYIRNSIKIVCDAYDGIPEYYVFDEKDPLLQCYRKVFPTLFRPLSEMDQEIRAHLRYPQLLFLFQAETYADYHQDVDTFYQREDSWSIPYEVYARGRRLVEPYYVIMKLPGEQREEFLIMLPMTLRGREERNMVAWMAARCDEPNYGQIVVYRFPKKQLAYGPMQIEYRISQDAKISELMTLWGQRGSRIIRGNTLAIPIEKSILYVEPIFLVSTVTTENAGHEGAGLPELRLVILSLGDKLAMGSNLDEALAALFGVAAPRAPVPSAAAPVSVTRAAAASLRQLLDKALQLEAEAQQLLRQGDLAGYQRKQQEQTDILRQMRDMAQ
ncbi:MAG: UPF0182 family protein [Armatimonadetes bacterium]|nr:UPF0182 family protein [Armatimonadota bacterium]